MTRRTGFTLIELIIVVAVIAILAAIAVPSLLQAQTRSKISRALGDMASLRVALESYAVDHGTYPLNAGGIGLSGAMYLLLAPRSYLTSLPNDVFQENTLYIYLADGTAITPQRLKYGSYTLASAGPDQRVDTSLSTTLVYDPTNGLSSTGDIVVCQRFTDPKQVQP